MESFNGKMNGKKPLTLKQKKFAKAYLETGNQTTAARIAGYAEPNPQGCQTLAKISKHEEFLEMMDKAGLTDAKLLAPLTSSLEAKHSDDVDHQVRLKGAELGLKLRGRIGKEETINNFNNSKVMIMYADTNGTQHDNQEGFLQTAL